MVGEPFNEFGTGILVLAAELRREAEAGGVTLAYGEGVVRVRGLKL